MPFESKSSATDASVSWIFQLCAPIDQPAPAPLIYTATSRRTSLFFSLSGCITLSKIRVSHCETAAIDPCYIVEEPDVWKAFFPSDLQMSPADHLRINIICENLEYQTVTKEQFRISSHNALIFREGVLVVKVVFEPLLSPIGKMVSIFHGPSLVIILIFTNTLEVFVFEDFARWVFAI